MALVSGPVENVLINSKFEDDDDVLELGKGKAGKKGKKARKAKKDADLDDAYAELATLPSENGEKPDDGGKDLKSEKDGKAANEKQGKKSRKAKKDAELEDAYNEVANLTEEAEKPAEDGSEEKNSKAGKDGNEKQGKKGRKAKKNAELEDAYNEVATLTVDSIDKPLEEGDGGKEGKESNEKQAKNKKDVKSKNKPAAVKSEPAKVPKPAAPAVPETAADDDEDEDDKDKSGKKDKKDKKKKKDAKGEKDAKKGPGKKQLAMMQEALRKIQEEEERLKREEEERIRKEEEEERLREEKLRLEQERKEKKKQKEKERRERLKKEGKLLNPKQKAAMQRAKMSIELMKQQGKIVIGGREKVKKADSNDNSETIEDAVTTPVTKELDGDEKENLSNGSPPSEDSDDDVRDTWEELEGPNIGEMSPSITETPLKLLSKSVEGFNQMNIKNAKEKPEIKDVEIKGKTVEEKPTPSEPTLRSPILCVLGHVDTGKTKLLDYLRKTHVQDNEAGGITQQIGATFVPPHAIGDQIKITKKATPLSLPGLLIIDTPGHESFTNLRSRGSSLCDIAVLVIDIMHGLEPQTIESINLLKSRKTPFVVALNKIDRLYDWKSNPRKDVEDLIRSQHTNTRLEFQQRTNEVILQLNEQSLNAALYYENNDPRSFVSLVPTSAVTGDGMGNLINLLVHYTQTMMAKKLIYNPDLLQATVLEVKAIPGLGTTIDVILVNGKLREGDRIVLAGHDGPISTHIRSLLVPQPLRELRVKSPYQELKVVYGSMGVKVAAHDLDKAVAGLELHVAKNDFEIEQLKNECWQRFGDAMKAIKCSDKGVYVQASTLGSLEALLEFLKVSKIPYCGVRIGPVVKRDIMKASIMLEHAPDYAVILAFDVKVEKDAQELADQLGVKIFTAEIIYHLFDKFTAYREELKQKRKEQFRNVAVFPCKLRILPQFIFNTRDPIVLGISVEDGVLMPGTPLAVPSKGNVEIGRVSSIEVNHKQVDSARRGQEVCVKIDHVGGDAPKLYGRHFDHEDMLVSRITRESVDALKEYFRDEMLKTDWALIIELKKVFEIM